MDTTKNVERGLEKFYQSKKDNNSYCLWGHYCFIQVSARRTNKFIRAKRPKDAGLVRCDGTDAGCAEAFEDVRDIDASASKSSIISYIKARQIR